MRPTQQAESEQSLGMSGSHGQRCGSQNGGRLLGAQPPTPTVTRWRISSLFAMFTCSPRDQEKLPSWKLDFYSLCRLTTETQET